MIARRGFTTGVHDEGSRRGFTTRVHRCDTVRAERAGWLGATSELRDGGSLKTASERVPSSPARLRLRRTADLVAQPIGRGRPDQPSRRRDREDAPRRGRFSARRSGSSRRGFTRRFTTGVHHAGSGLGFTRRFTTRVHRCDTVRAERAGRLGATSELRDGGSLKTASERGPIVAGQASSPAYGRPRCPTDWARTFGSAMPATRS